MAHLEALAGFNVPLTAAFTDSAGTPVDPDDYPTLTVYDPDRKVIFEQVMTIDKRTGTGVYLFNYAPPKSLMKWYQQDVEISAEFVATVSEVQQVGGRHTIRLSWAD